MNYLIADTTDKALTVIAVKGNEEFVYFNHDNVKHNSVIIPAIDKVLSDSGMTVNDIDVFSAVTGPGSFTGIRIGVTVMNAFADVTKGKLISVNTFEMLGYGHKNVVALIDARAGYYYGAEIMDGKIIRAGDYRDADLDLNLLPKIYKKNIDYSRQLIDLVKEKSTKGEYVKILSPYYLKFSQAEREFVKKNYKIVPMEEKHLSGVLEIESSSFITPWTEKMYSEVLNNENALNYVIESNNTVISYYSLLQIYDEMHIMKIAVRDTMRRQGYADIMMSHIREKTAENKDIKSITLEVRVSNTAAQALYEKYGFLLIGKRLKYYEMREDALIYTLELGR